MENVEKHITFTVTNDLTHDQRMIRICSSLAEYGYQITLIGRQTKKSAILSKKTFAQKRIRCFFNSGFFTDTRNFKYDITCKKVRRKE